MILLVISHTEHYRNESGIIVGWSSTVKEMDQLASVFTSVIHIGCFYHVKAPKGMTAYKAENVRFIPIPPFGGRGLRKLSVIFLAPVILSKVFYYLMKADVFQFRAPTSMGTYLIPCLSIFTRKKGWFKYAGNWNHPHPPTSYAYQRYWLEKIQLRKVTINGTWPNQPSHCLSFENPCLTQHQLEMGDNVIMSKNFNNGLNIIFVGRLDEHKGADLLLGGILQLKTDTIINEIHIVGDGPLRSNLENLSKSIDKKIIFHGFLNQNELFLLLEKIHLLVLPSASEGFPKVVAEGWNFGCIPIVTNVSSIGQYVIEGINGFLIDADKRNANGIEERLLEILHLNPEVLYAMAKRGRNESKKFLYSRYLNRITNEIVNDQSTSQR